MRRTGALLIALLGLCAVIAVVAGTLGTRGANAKDLYSQLAPIQKRILSGFASNELNARGVASAAASQAPKKLAKTTASALGCPDNFGNNQRVNQNCLNISDSDLQGRGQAENEPAIAVDPNKKDNVVASYNDYRRGDGTCGTSYSGGGATKFEDSTVPNGFTRGNAFGGVAREYWQASGDTSVAWDTKGNAYLGCQVFMRGTPTSNNPDLSSAIYLFRSTQSAGASWNFPGRPVVEENDVAGTGCCLLDKPYMTVDNHAGSPFQDRVYVTWTFFDADGTAYLYEAYSNDYGEHFSAPVLVSGDSSLCVNTFGLPTPHGTCNENQDSQPFTGPDGNLYVVYTNYNNALANAQDNHNQILIVKSTDGGATFGAPVKVSDFYDLPDCPTYQGGQDGGRACVPEKGSSMHSVFRANNYASGAVNPKDSSQIAVTFGSYINSHSNESNGCVPAGLAGDGQDLYTGVKTPGACNNDILVSVSSNGGASFTGTATDPRSLTSVTQDPAQASTDQYWQWADFASNGKFGVSYYDRQYGNDETTGYSDISLSGSKDLSKFKSKQVTSSSMPPPTEFPDAQGNSLFYGDYAGLAVADEGSAYPIWSDTRTVDLFLCPGTGAPGAPPALCNATEPGGLQANDEDVFTAKLGLP